jgi:hypothetical protein
MGEAGASVTESEVAVSVVVLEMAGWEVTGRSGPQPENAESKIPIARKSLNLDRINCSSKSE